ncbi:MAG: phosphoribosylanthranilate isomerase [Arcticibacterium sp.]
MVEVLQAELIRILGKIQVKVCCISSVPEALLAIEKGANFLGLIAEMPSGPGVISNKTIKEIIETVRGKVETVLLSSRTSVRGIIEQYKMVNTSCIQIVDTLSNGTHGELKSALPGVKIIQVLHVLGESTLQEAKDLGTSVDYILLDSGNPSAKTKILGGTGKIHDWSISSKIVKLAKVPIFLAGGISAKNAVFAVETVKPFGLDVCSGLRTDENLDSKKIDDFFELLKRYF